MIQPIQLNNISFKGENTQIERIDPSLVEQYGPNEDIPADRAELITIEKTPDEIKEKHSAKEYFKAARDCCIDFIKNFNETFGLVSGATKGAVAGSAATLGIAFIGKNIQLAKGDIAKTLKFMGSDIAKGFKTLVHIAPNLIKKAPLDNLKSIANTPKGFYTQYLKGAKATGSIATTAGLAIFALNVVRERVKANVKNANVDHATHKPHLVTD